VDSIRLALINFKIHLNYCFFCACVPTSSQQYECRKQSRSCDWFNQRHRSRLCSRVGETRCQYHRNWIKRRQSCWQHTRRFEKVSAADFLDLKFKQMCINITKYRSNLNRVELMKINAGLNYPKLIDAIRFSCTHNDEILSFSYSYDPKPRPGLIESVYSRPAGLNTAVLSWVSCS
jgi:hypothetical protein